MLMLVAACATSPSTSRLTRAGAPNGLRVEVTNRSFEDLQVAVARTGMVITLGTVPRLSTRSFALSPVQFGAGGSIELLAGTRSQPTARRSAAFTASLGQRVEWVIDYALPSYVVVVR